MIETLILEPIEDRIAVEPIEQNNTFADGQLVLPESAKERPQQGTIIAVGKGRWDTTGNRIPMTTKIGDKILFAKYAGIEVKIDGKKVLIFKESDVLAILKREG